MLSIIAPIENHPAEDMFRAAWRKLAQRRICTNYFNQQIGPHISFVSNDNHESIEDAIKSGVLKKIASSTIQPKIQFEKAITIYTHNEKAPARNSIIMRPLRSRVMEGIRDEIAVHVPHETKQEHPDLWRMHVTIGNDIVPGDGLHARSITESYIKPTYPIALRNLVVVEVGMQLSEVARYPFKLG